MICPICNNFSYEQIITIDCMNFDNHILYNPIEIVSCASCKHVYNRITKEDYNYLHHSYKYEFTYNLLASSNIISDFPGSYNEYSKRRYDLLYNFIKDYLRKDSKILDMGCASGGFLSHLYNYGYRSLQGIEISNTFVEMADKRNGNKFNIRVGNIEDLPYDDNQFNFIVADQVVEHIFDLNNLFKEITRILSKNGILCISVPHAPNYIDACFFEYYWFIMREHIQHFDLNHLRALAAKHGLTLLDNQVTLSNMLSPNAKLPNLSLILKNTGNKIHSKNHSVLKNMLGTYISKSKEKAKITYNTIEHLVNTPIYVFGMSREFLYLYNNTPLRECNIIKFIDDTSYKQEHYTLQGRHIYGSNSLKGVTNSILITAVAHNETLRNKLLKIGFKGKIIEL